jgi:hypothetical protein
LIALAPSMMEADVIVDHRDGIYRLRSDPALATLMYKI